MNDTILTQVFDEFTEIVWTGGSLAREDTHEEALRAAARKLRGMARQMDKELERLIEDER